ncbi:MAG: hypothetical protein CVU42_17270 [Chloroflexi bacterium HGW-Chloroflexi-4]|jgi:hypothetical protein|nr:MAG: hypothetical protein CVU42_17270 [Chloroflexi bacterium HGW-Chloroflexi-4]
MDSQSYILSQTSRHSKRKISIVLFFILLAAAVVLSFLIFLLISINSAYQNSAKLAEGIVTNPAAADYYDLSTDQAKLINQYGYPDSFTITFYIDEFDPYFSGEVRDETWRYYDELLEYDFYNGVLMYTVPIDDPPAQWIPLPYMPEQFTAYASLDTILASAEINDIFELPLEDELVKNGKLFYAPGLTFGTVRDRLVYVETVLMVEGGE